MSKLFVVFGATGQQGGAVVRGVLKDPELSKTFKVRAVTRDISKPAAEKLKDLGAEVVAADFADAASLAAALKGANFVFTMTTYRVGNEVFTMTTDSDNNKRSVIVEEFIQGKVVADAAVAAGVEYIIFSTLVNSSEISHGKYKGIVHFDDKHKIETYIRSLPIKSAFFAAGCFMQNFYSFMAPSPTGDGDYVMANVVNPQTALPLIDTEDSGKWINAILSDPGKYEGKFIAAAIRLYTFEEIAESLTKFIGKTIRYVQIPVEQFKSFLPPATADELTEMFLFFQDYGYYGPKSQELVEWGASQARGKLTTLEEYVAKNPLKLT